MILLFLNKGFGGGLIFLQQQITFVNLLINKKLKKCLIPLFL